MLLFVGLNMSYMAHMDMDMERHRAAPHARLHEPAAVRRSQTNRPMCARKRYANNTCVKPKHHLDELASLETNVLAELMADSHGDWEPGKVVNATWRATHQSFGMPRGVLHFDNRGHINHELGRGHSWLPVTRTFTQQDHRQVGLWFHYMRGCSDLAWNVGRTLLARNKCHAAGMLEQRVCIDCSWERASRRVARKLVLTVRRRSFQPALLGIFKREDLMESLATVNSTGDVSVALENEVIAALNDCAYGRPLGDSNTRKVIVNLIGVSNALDYVCAATVADELRGAAAIDTIQFTNQCEVPNCFMGDDGNVEIWDLRSVQAISTDMDKWRAVANLKESGSQLSHTQLAQLRATALHDAEALPTSPPVFRRLNGSECGLSRGWPRCIACGESHSERNCMFKCTKSGLLAIDDGELIRDGMEKPDYVWFLRNRFNVSPVSYSTLWRHYWGPLVGSVAALRHGAMHGASNRTASNRTVHTPTPPSRSLELDAPSRVSTAK